jgi:hypothetical protein
VIITSATPRGELDTLVESITANVTDIGEDRLLQREAIVDSMDVE